MPLVQPGKLHNHSTRPHRTPSGILRGADGLSRQDQAPFRAGGLWALKQLIGTEGMQHSQTLPPAPTTIDQSGLGR